MKWLTIDGQIEYNQTTKCFCWIGETAQIYRQIYSKLLRKFKNVEYINEAIINKFNNTL